MHSQIYSQILCKLGGAALCLALSNATVALAANEADPQKGVRTFNNLCAPCHAVSPGRHMTGPSLSGIVGRKAGSVAGFERYSKALPQSKVEWNEETLTAWLTNPQAVVPGNTMAVIVDDAQARADIVAYLLATQAAGGPTRDDIPKPFDKTLDLKSSGPASRVTDVSYCRDTYTVKLENGASLKFWENNLRFKSDSSAKGPSPGKPVLVPGGQQGDRAYLVFAAPQDFSAAIKPECNEPAP